MDGVVAQIALGCVTFGREINREVAFAIMDYAAENKIRFWDTAAVYGNGASEKIIGEWLSANPIAGKHINVATKMLAPYNAVTIEKAVDESLSRLHKTFIDVLYLHNWHPSALTNSTIHKFHAQIQLGKIGGIGLSNFNHQQLSAFVENAFKLGFNAPAYIQNNHNLAVSDLSPEMIGICNQRKIKIITYSPLGAGFLTGKHLQKIEPGSRFAIMPGHQNIYFTNQAGHRLNAVLKVSQEAAIPPAELALAWAFSQSYVSHVLIGARTKQHIRQSIYAVNNLHDLMPYVDKIKAIIGGAHE